jgi:hypothetical protein
MRKTIVFGLSILIFATPALALAQNIPLGQTIQQLTAVAAALEAQEAAASGQQQVACAALFSAPSVQLNRHVVLAWGSVGAMSPGDDPSKSMWTQNGSSILSFTQSGTWTYSFTFYAKSGATATCTAKIVVLP